MKQTPSSREEFMIETWPTIKKVNGIMNKLFDLYFIDSDPDGDLTNMMKTVVPPFYVDPNEPIYPGVYILAGKSSVSYLERMCYITPFVDKKRKYMYDLAAWRGTVIDPLTFNNKTKGFRKTKLEPMVIMGDGISTPTKQPQSVILKEKGMKAKDECILPFVSIPAPHVHNYQQIMDALYAPFYNYLYNYLKTRTLNFIPVSDEDIATLKEESLEIKMPDGDVVIISRNIVPTLKAGDSLSIAEVPDPIVPENSGKRHYILREDHEEDENHFLTIYTLVAILSIL